VRRSIRFAELVTNLPGGHSVNTISVLIDILKVVLRIRPWLGKVITGSASRCVGFALTTVVNPELALLDKLVCSVVSSLANHYPRFGKPLTVPFWSFQRLSLRRSNVLVVCKFRPASHGFFIEPRYLPHTDRHLDGLFGQHSIGALNRLSTFSSSKQ